MAKKVKLQKFKCYSVTVPSAVCQLKGWQKGQTLYWIEGKEGLILTTEEKKG
jgi:hypothetical protein